MYKLIALPLILIVLSSCGSKEAKLDHDQIYKILAQEEGMIAGISIGDEWSTLSAKMETENKDVFVVDSDATYGTFEIGEGDQASYFSIECLLSDGKVTGIDITLKDKQENQAGFEKLHDKLSEFFTKRFPDGYVDHPGGDYAGYGEWKIMESEKEFTLSMGELDKNAKFQTSTFPIGVHGLN